MAIEYPTAKNGPSSRTLRSDPRRTSRAPFWAGLSAPALREVTRLRRVGESSRTIARCPACGEQVRGDEDYVRHRGDLYHAECVLYRQGGRARR